MNPTYWLLIVLVAMVAVAFFVGLAFYQIGYDQGHADAQPDRHHHRKGDPPAQLPRAGRLPLEVLADPDAGPFGPAEAAFAGREEWRPLGRAEYDLITTTAEVSSLRADVEDARSATGEIRALTEEMDAWIAEHITGPSIVAGEG